MVISQRLREVYAVLPKNICWLQGKAMSTPGLTASLPLLNADKRSHTVWVSLFVDEKYWKIILYLEFKDLNQNELTNLGWCFNFILVKTHFKWNTAWDISKSIYLINQIIQRHVLRNGSHMIVKISCFPRWTSAFPPQYGFA